MKYASLLLLFALCFSGCEYQVPLSTTPVKPVDSRVIGAWEGKSTRDGRTLHIAILPFSEKEVLVHCPYESGKGNAFFKGSMVEVAGISLMQLEYLGTSSGKLPEAKKGKYTYSSITVDDKGKLVIRRLNIAVVSKTTKTTAELIAAITAKKDDPKLFKEPTTMMNVVILREREAEARKKEAEAKRQAALLRQFDYDGDGKLNDDEKARAAQEKK